MGRSESVKLRPYTVKAIKHVSMMNLSIDKKIKELRKCDKSYSKCSNEYKRKAIEYLKKMNIIAKPGDEPVLLHLEHKKFVITNVQINFKSELLSELNEIILNGKFSILEKEEFPTTESLVLRENYKRFKSGASLDRALGGKGGIFSQVHKLVSEHVLKQQGFMTYKQFLRDTKNCRPKSVYINKFVKGTVPEMKIHVDMTKWPTCVINLSDKTTASISFRKPQGGNLISEVQYTMTNQGHGLIFGQTAHRVLSPEGVVDYDRLTMVIFYG